MGSGDSFSQQQINAGQLRYVHVGGDDTRDSFRFNVDNGVVSSATSVFQITVTPPAFCTDGYSPDAITDPGTNLNCLLDPEPWAVEAGIPALDLTRPVYAGSDDALLTSLQALSELSDFELSQDPLTREVLVSGPGLLARLLPVAITQGDGTALTSLVYDSGRPLLVTEDGQQIEFFTLVHDLQLLRDGLADLDLALEFDGAGNLLITGEGLEGYYVVRPALVAVPASATLTPGLHIGPTNLLPGLPEVKVVFSDGEGRLWQQLLLPVPADWEALQAASLALPEVDAVTLDETGIIQVQIGTALLRVIADYVVQPDNTSPNADASSSDTVVIGPLGDSNGDGIADFTVQYPDGETQRFHVLP